MKLAIIVLTIGLTLLSVTAQPPQPQPAPIYNPQPYSINPQAPDQNAEIYKWVDLGLSIGAMVFGVLSVFLGYRLVRVVFFLAGAILLFFITLSLLEQYTLATLPQPWMRYLIAGGAGLVGGLLLSIVTTIGFFIFGGLAGMCIALLIIGGTPLNAMLTATWMKWTAIGGTALVCAIVAVILKKPVAIIGSSITGSYIIFSTADSNWIHSSFSDILKNIFNGTPKPFDVSDWKPYVLIGAVVALAIIGIIVQFLVTARNYNHDQTQRVEEDPYHSHTKDGIPLLSKVH